MDKEILNMEEAAELFNVSIKTFIKLLKEEKVPARKIGREWRFSRQALIQWLSSGDSMQYSSSDSDSREFFDSVAPEWENLRGDYYDEAVIGRLFDTGLLKESMTLVDLGAGDGYLSRAVSPKVKKVIAVDISGEMLKELNKKAVRGGLANIRTVEGDGCDMPLEDESVDLVCTNMFLHHVEEPLLAIKEMYRVLKPGGRVYLADLKEHSNVEFKDRMHDIWQGFSQNRVREWFAECGFKNIQIESVNKKPAGKKGDEGIFVLLAEK
ncbi:MAG TPA: methyltransferase domain-containing protein [Clostridia bacterium]|nr:methyltransferase domain-containing protein [Clostridia bacterium]